MHDQDKLTDEQWRRKLSPERYRVLRKKGTEPAFSGAFYRKDENGTYICAGCGAELFSSETKYDSGSGWPSFWAPLGEAAIDEHEDRSLGMRRTEVTCGRCGGHLGHVFTDGPEPTGMRYCLNSLSLEFSKTAPAEGATVIRCGWEGEDPLSISYHDREWGFPVHDDITHFEFLVLESAQAGLSWMTILRKREGYRKAYDGFDPALVARYDEDKIGELLANPGIVRNRRKIEASITTRGGFSRYRASSAVLIRTSGDTSRAPR